MRGNRSHKADDATPRIVRPRVVRRTIGVENEQPKVAINDRSADR